MFVYIIHDLQDHIGGARFVADYFAEDAPEVISSRRTRWKLKKQDMEDPTTAYGNNRDVPIPEWYQEEVLEVGNLQIGLGKAHVHQSGDLFIVIDKNLPENAAEGGYEMEALFAGEEVLHP